MTKKLPFTFSPAVQRSSVFANMTEKVLLSPERRYCAVVAGWLLNLSLLRHQRSAQRERIWVRSSALCLNECVPTAISQRKGCSGDSGSFWLDTSFQCWNQVDLGDNTGALSLFVTSEDKQIIFFRGPAKYWGCNAHTQCTIKFNRHTHVFLAPKTALPSLPSPWMLHSLTENYLKIFSLCFGSILFGEWFG